MKRLLLAAVLCALPFPALLAAAALLRSPASGAEVAILFGAWYALTLVVLLVVALPFAVLVKRTGWHEVASFIAAGSLTSAALAALSHVEILRPEFGLVSYLKSLVVLVPAGASVGLLFWAIGVRRESA